MAVMGCHRTLWAVVGMEAAPRFELGNNGFADRRLSHLAMPPSNWEPWSLHRKLPYFQGFGYPGGYPSAHPPALLVVHHDRNALEIRALGAN